MKNWMDYFKPHIVDRGCSLFLDDAVQVCQQMEAASSRNRYRQLAGYLVKIAGLPDGKVVSASLRTSWKIQYPRRKAMIEELDAVRW